MSRKSLIREQRLKANLASIARQGALMTAATHGFGAPQPQSPPLALQSQQQFTQHQKSLELPGHSQQQLQLPGQAQHQLELPHGQLEEHGSHPQQIQLNQPRGMEQSHLAQQQLQVWTESQQMLEQQQTELQQESGENNEVPTSPTITSSGSGGRDHEDYIKRLPAFVKLTIPQPVVPSNYDVPPIPRPVVPSNYYIPRPIVPSNYYVLPIPRPIVPSNYYIPPIPQPVVPSNYDVPPRFCKRNEE